MKLFFSCLILFLIFSIPASASYHSENAVEHHIYRVVHVIDGDTIWLDNGEKVRLIGIDSPEMKDGQKLQRDLRERHLTKRAELAMGQRSYKFTKNLIEGKKVRLEFDKERYDEYDRVLAYVYLTNGVFVNAQILKEGYAYVSTIKPDVRYSKLFKEIYNQAKEAHRGLWHSEESSKKRLKWF